MDKLDTIKVIVAASVQSFANGFKGRHEGEVGDPEGTINMKIHNVFIEVLGKEIQYYSALARSLDSSLGNMLEDLAINIASLSYEVRRNVEGPLNPAQTSKIAEMLEKYKRHEIKPHIADYQCLREMNTDNRAPTKRHDSDYYLIVSHKSTKTFGMKVQFLYRTEIFNDYPVYQIESPKTHRIIYVYLILFPHNSRCQ